MAGKICAESRRADVEHVGHGLRASLSSSLSPSLAPQRNSQERCGEGYKARIDTPPPPSPPPPPPPLPPGRGRFGLFWCRHHRSGQSRIPRRCIHERTHRSPPPPYPPPSPIPSLSCSDMTETLVWSPSKDDAHGGIAVVVEVCREVLGQFAVRLFRIEVMPWSSDDFLRIFLKK